VASDATQALTLVHLYLLRNWDRVCEELTDLLCLLLDEAILEELEVEVEFFSLYL
jgi:hypothetical protein